jgi:CDP-glucose 4,6-dehydratase
MTTLRFYKGRRVLITGHTGFKGRWLAAWLDALGARVSGLSLPAAEEQQAGWELAPSVSDHVGDVRDLACVEAAVRRSRPEVVFHLAAQALVRPSYRDPVGTFATNVLGTVNVLEAARNAPSVAAVVVVTSDKCYANREWPWGYREDEAMGGHDPYSASKGCAELVTAAYRTSYGLAEKAPRLASARAGNVIGGGDWAEDRIVPDLVRGLAAGRPIDIRRPDAIRPWQHVLEPLAGYLMLAEALVEGGARWAQGWNFGPSEVDPWCVGELARRFVARWGGGQLRLAEAPAGPHEAHFLKLDSSRARQELGWRPLLSAEERLEWTADWYRRWHEARDMAWDTTRRQIDDYTQRLTAGQSRLPRAA